MLKKPSILTLLLISISLLLILVFNLIITALGIKINVGIYSSFPIIVAFIIGMIYTGIYKEVLPKKTKQKIAIYYFSIQLILSLILLAITTMIAPKIQTTSSLFTVLSVTTFMLSIIKSIILYFALGLGCKQKLKQIEKIKRAQTK